MKLIPFSCDSYDEVERVKMANATKKNEKSLKTTEDWLNTPDDRVKYDLINGEIVAQAAASPKHSLFQTELASILVNWNKKQRKTDDSNPPGWKIMVEAGVEYDNHNSFIHDIAGWKIENWKQFYKSEPEKPPVRLKPDWVCEILSSNWKTDTYYKLNTLQQYKIPFYWIVDLKASIITVYEFENDSLKYRLYGTFSLENTPAVFAPFLGLEINIKELFENL